MDARNSTAQSVNRGLRVLTILYQAAIVILTLLLLFSLRRQFGLAPMYVFIGALQVLQTLSATIFVQTELGLLMSPGSSVMFGVGLVGVLLVYLRHDAMEAQRMIFALLAANASAGAVMFLLSLQIHEPSVFNGPSFSEESLFQGSGMLVLGTVLLAIDALLVVVLYEFFARRAAGVFLPILATLVLVLAFDSLVFVSAAFWGDPKFLSILVNSVLSKALIATGYAVVSAAYLHWFERELFVFFAGTQPRDIFAMLTYRQKYELLLREAMHDGLTGVYNRAYFNATAQHDVSTCWGAQRPLSLLFIDLDRFKQVNDTHGAQVGDAVLRATAECLARGRRPADHVSRFGGEEFAVVLPNTSVIDALSIAEKLRMEIALLHAQGLSPVKTTASFGVSSLPEDGTTLPQLVEAADRRLQRAKASGRDRVETRD